MAREGLGCGVQGLSKGEVWVVGGAYAQDPQGWKWPWGLWGVGLKLMEQKGPRCAPHSSLRGQGTSPGSLASFLGLRGWGKCPPLLACFSHSAPPACLSWSPRSPSYSLKDPRGLERGLEGRGSAWELSRLPGPQWAGQSPSAPLPLLPEGPSRLPL